MDSEKIQALIQAFQSQLISAQFTREAICDELNSEELVNLGYKPGTEIFREMLKVMKEETGNGNGN